VKEELSSDREFEDALRIEHILRTSEGLFG
jgi:hypothetical protein